MAKAEQKHYNYTRRLLAKEKLNITPGQMAVIYTLYKGDGISITELGKKCYLDNSTLTGIIDRLERSGLVLRTGQQEDRRSFLICLTAAARALEGRITEIMDRICNSMLAECTEEEIAAFRKVLLNVFARL
ncbi:MarR family winged helix-turn-helix transcriptional regulator [Sporomusa termitida]|uniref:MarR family winged helix-turn-helix transcriptional regulator n=1 Tax=Sporomusa termitida TaxID=2377 RepID=UPI001FE5E578|nr:MarR family transcriptional regulator [Sporomusa termitida]